MMQLAGLADVVDLDGPALLEHDCKHALKYEGGKVFAPHKKLWGFPSL